MSVLDGDAEFGVSDCRLVLEKMRGNPLVLLTQIFQHSPAVFITKEGSGISNPYEMIDRKVAIDVRNYSLAPLLALLQQTIGGANRIESVPEGKGVEDLISGKADVIAGDIALTPFLMKNQGVAYRIINPQEYGIDMYGDNLFTSGGVLEKHPLWADRIVRACRKGWEYALRNPDEIIDLILKKYNSDLTRPQLSYEAKMTALMITPDVLPLGSVTAHRIQPIVDTYVKNGLAHTEIVWNEFLFQDVTPLGNQGGVPDQPLPLTKKEREWLDKHGIIRIGVDADYAPYSFRNENGAYEGLAVDMVHWISDLLKIRMEIVPDLKWPEIVVGARNRDLDVIATAVDTEERKKFLVFSKVYIPTPLVIMTIKGDGRIVKPRDLAGKKVALVKEYSSSERVLREHPQVEPFLVDTPLEGLLAVSTGVADAYVGVLGINLYLAGRHGIPNLQIASDYDLTSTGQRFGVRGDWPELATILDKALNAIPEKEKIKLFKNWIPIEYQVDDREALMPLSPEDAAWLEAHPEIRVGMMDDWAPMDYVDESDRPKGIGVDYIRLINKRLKGVLTLVPGPFKENYRRVREKELDMLLDITPKKEREAHFHFTGPYFSVPHVLVGRKGGPYYNSEKDLTGKTVALERGFYNVKYFRDRYPEVNIKEFPSTSTALDAVSRGEADAYAGNRAVAMYLIEKELLANLQIQGRMDKPPVVLAMGIRKDWPKLAALVDRALSSIRPEEIREIHRNWLTEVESVKPAAHFTDEDRKWLEKHPKINVGIMNAWPPMDYLDEEGKPRGMGVDFIQALNERLGGRLNVVPGPWGQIYDRVKNREIDACMDITPTKEREPYFHFTRPYAKIPHVIVSRKNGPYHSSLEDLKGKTLALESGFFTIAHLKANYPQITIKEYKSTREALENVSNGSADAYVGNQAAALYLIEKGLMENLELQGKLNATASVNSIGVRKDWPRLVMILDRALAALTQEEVRSIYRKWGGLGDHEEPSLSWISLNPKEKVWLNEHPVLRVAATSQWAPVEYLDTDGKYKGAAIDHLKLVAQMLGVRLQFQKDLKWAEALELFETGKLDIMAAAVETPQRKKYATFTRSYLSLPTAVYTHEDAPYIQELDDLTGKRVAVVKGFAVEEYLKKNFPQLDLVEASDVPQALDWLQSRKVYAYIGSLLVTGHYIRQGGHANLKVSGQTDYKYELAMAARSDWPMLAGLLQKTLDSIDETERNRIFRDWVAISYQRQIDYSLLWKIVIGAFLLFAIIFYWNRRLSVEVSQRRRAQEDLKTANRELVLARDRAQEADHIKSAFLASMSHELRTPLNSIIGFTGILLQGLVGPLNEEQTKQLGMVKKSSQHLLSLINDVLDVSKIEAGQLKVHCEPFDLRLIFQNVVMSIKPMADKKELDLILELDPNVEMIHSDWRRVEQILINLVNNAVKFTDQGQVRITGWIHDSQVHISVRDTGIGIQADDMEKLFDAFRQIETGIARRYEGTGLGLSISRKLVELLGGKIWAESEGQGRGSTFTFTLPLDKGDRE